MPLPRWVVTGSSFEQGKDLATKENDLMELAADSGPDTLSRELLYSVIEHDSQAISDGKLISDAINHSISSFVPDLIFENLVKNYSMARHIYGKSLLRQITGYDERYLENNIRIPEFRRELMERINERITGLKQGKLLDKRHALTDKAFELACAVMYVEELDRLLPKGEDGDRLHRKASVYGDKYDARAFSRDDRYRDISVQKTVKTAVRRKHHQALKDDIRAFERRARGQVSIIYALDASGSMRGKKIENCKKAGIALAYKAIEENDKVGLIVFGKNVENAIRPSRNFTELLKAIVRIRASSETDIANTIRKAVDMFTEQDSTKHLVLITDAMPTAGKHPEKETLKAASLAKGSGMTISIIGIGLNKKGRELAEKIAEIGEGKLYYVKDADDVDMIVLEDYYSLEE